MHISAPLTSEINFEDFCTVTGHFQPEVGLKCSKIVYFSPYDLRNQLYEDFWTGSGHFPTGSAQKLYILAPLNSEINFVRIFGPQVVIFQPEVLKNCIFWPL